MANGDNLIVGKDNYGEDPTILHATREWGGLFVNGEAVGVLGTCGDVEGSSGVRGVGGPVGVEGISPGTGVRGIAESLGGSSNGTGVYGFGQSPGSIGVRGESSDSAGVYGYSNRGAGVVGQTGNPNDYAGYFWGAVWVNGDFTVTGAKSAAVPHPDGSHRRMYSLESPESWFEDFGTAKLIRGKVKVKLERVFAALVQARNYHVFLSPEGDSNGLYVHRKDQGGFEVREQQGGKHSLQFSYRVLAKRRDIRAPRMPKVTAPHKPTPPKPPKVTAALPEHLGLVGRKRDGTARRAAT